VRFTLLGGLAATAVVLATLPAAAQNRDQIRIVGSSTVFPYTQAVSEQFSNATGMRAPVVESTGTGGGMQAFCGGVGPATPDITGASRPMTQSEWTLCQTNGVNNVTEALIGYDGLSVAVSRSNDVALDFTKAQLFQALAAEVEVNGQVVANPYNNWSEIDPSLPNIPITVFGPPPTSGTRDAWVELVMVPGCRSFAALEALEPARRTEVCARMRQDGKFIEAGENDNLIVQRLNQDANAFGIFGYSFLYENMDALKPIAIDSVEPSPETIADGTYGVSRPLFFYVKNAHRGVIAGLQEFVEFYMQEDAIGPGGYLTERGLVPLPDDVRAADAAAVVAGAPFTRYPG
jgi:phosphate transport system substrate-binding protein